MAGSADREWTPWHTSRHLPISTLLYPGEKPGSLGLSDLAVLTPFLITLFGQFGGVALQLAEVVEGIGARQFAGMDQAHEQVAHFGAV